ncbi:MAG TPA: hypothetical protein PLI16_08970 [Bacteroidales bacterium]|jgi:hypothetical protein|nr:hypothetical protein [Bacteroidales bacterium]HOH84728.1 hypothetical protein [Bacteroidales bacterium]HPB25511.1 hypothetical protein [Bacteroidales bacterium]HPI30205.1 hypothetical protein [Bacteroidales bacterium]HQN16130.1 hypothetical protein [Bacteroidales bacterium]
MKKVSLELSPEQYKELLKLVYVGDWVIDETENIVLNDMVQTVFSKAEEAGLKGLVEFNKEQNLFVPSLQMDEEVIDLINDYDDECFWDTLIFGLAERDAEKVLGEDLENKSLEEKVELLEPYTKKYIKEFEENGLDNIKV